MQITPLGGHQGASQRPTRERLDLIKVEVEASIFPVFSLFLFEFKFRARLHNLVFVVALLLELGDLVLFDRLLGNLNVWLLNNYRL